MCLILNVFDVQLVQYSMRLMFNVFNVQCVYLSMYLNHLFLAMFTPSEKIFTLFKTKHVHEYSTQEWSVE